MKENQTTKEYFCRKISIGIYKGTKIANTSIELFITVHIEIWLSYLREL